MSYATPPRRLSPLILGAMLLAFVPSTAFSLIIDSAVIRVGRGVVPSPLEVNIAQNLTDGQRYNFDLHQFFPLAFREGEATGFVLIDEGPQFGSLTKGLRLSVARPGVRLNAELEIKAHWIHPAGFIEQQIEVIGTVKQTAIVGDFGAGLAHGQYDAELSPFLGAVFDHRTLIFGEQHIHDGRGPETEFLEAGRIDYHDLLFLDMLLDANAPAGSVAEGNFLGTMSEVSRVVPEPPPLLLFVLGALSMMLLCYLRLPRLRRSPPLS